MLLEPNKIYNGDCLNLMTQIDDQSINLILTDLPYGSSGCAWDIVLPFDLLWKEYERIIKDNGVIVLFGSQPFSSLLITSNLKLFKYELIWNKKIGGDFLNAKNKPMKSHENILVFSKATTANGSSNKMVYNPQKTIGKPYTKIQRTENRRGTHDAGTRKPFEIGFVCKNDGKRYPLSILEFSKVNGKKSKHPTQKPVELLEWLVKTYSNEGDLVLDSCMGSGTTVIACKNTKRNFIGIEKDSGYFKIAEERIKND